MTTSTESPLAVAADVSRRRIIIFRVLTTIALLMFAFALPNVLTPWVNVDFQNDGVIRGWQDAVEGTLDAVFWMAMVGLLLKPLARPLLAQYLIAVAAVAMSVLPAAGGTMVVVLVLLLLPVISYPRPRLLLDLHAPRIDRPAMTVGVLAAAVLLPLAAAAWSASDNQNATYAEHLALLAIAGLVAATRKPGWRWLAWPTAAAWGYLGVVAMAFPHEVDSFGRLGGAACVVAAVGFALTSLRPEAAPD